MSWIKKDAYHMTNGEWSIAKYFIKDKVIYGLWKENVNKGYYSSFEEAKLKYEEMQK